MVRSEIYVYLPSKNSTEKKCLHTLYGTFAEQWPLWTQVAYSRRLKRKG